jgi:hypothetical protein
VILVAAVGKVHAHNIEASLTEFVDGLDRVRLGANRADDGSPTEVTRGLESSIELGKPVDSAAELKVIEGGGRHLDSTRRLYFLVLVWSGR